jgi:hypothetical protein
MEPEWSYTFTEARHLTPVYALESDLFINYFNIVLLLTSISLKSYAYNFLCLLYPSVTAKCPVSLNFLHFITLILEGHYFIWQVSFGDLRCAGIVSSIATGLTGQSISHIFMCPAWPLKMRPMQCSETSITNYQSTLRKIPEERRSHLHCGGNMKSNICFPLSVGWSSWEWDLVLGNVSSFYINKMEGVYWINLAQDRDEWRVLVLSSFSPSGFIKWKELLTVWAFVNFSRTNLLYEFIDWFIYIVSSLIVLMYYYIKILMYPIKPTAKHTAVERRWVSDKIWCKYAYIQMMKLYVAKFLPPNFSFLDFGN